MSLDAWLAEPSLRRHLGRRFKEPLLAACARQTQGLSAAPTVTATLPPVFVAKLRTGSLRERLRLMKRKTTTVAELALALLAQIGSPPAEPDLSRLATLEREAKTRVRADKRAYQRRLKKLLATVERTFGSKPDSDYELD